MVSNWTPLLWTKSHPVKDFADYIFAKFLFSCPCCRSCQLTELSLSNSTPLDSYIVAQRWHWSIKISERVQHNKDGYFLRKFLYSSPTVVFSLFSWCVSLCTQSDTSHDFSHTVHVKLFILISTFYCYGQKIQNIIRHHSIIQQVLVIWDKKIFLCDAPSKGKYSLFLA